MNHRKADHEALIGVVIAGGFGAGWAFWAASGLNGDAAAVVRIVAAVLAAALILSALVRRRAAGADGTPDGPESGSMFGSRGYLAWVTAEVGAIVAGNAVLGATGHGGYVPAWTALVVGVHFIGFGRLFAPVFYWVGVAFIAAAVVGGVVGAAGASGASVEVTTGLLAAISLFAAGAWGLLASAPSETPPTTR